MQKILLYVDCIPTFTTKGTLICSNAKLKATGKWTPRYTTTQAFIATVGALE
jgi:hypothetical protein